MYGSRWQAVVCPTSARLIAYNGSPIHCVGSLTIACKYKDSTWRDQLFYVVDVSGPIVIGLPLCSELHVVTIHETHTQSAIPASKPPVKSVKDLQEMYLSSLTVLVISKEMQSFMSKKRQFLQSILHASVVSTSKTNSKVSWI